jgi:hypothetical protein
MGATRPFKFIGVVICLFGIVITVYGVTHFLEKKDLEGKGIVVKGVVSEIHVDHIYRSPFVKFSTLEGKEMVFLSELMVNVDLFDYEVGQEVEVIYHRDNPKNSRIYAFWEMNFGHLFLGLFGGFLVLLGLFLRWLGKRGDKRA